MHQPLCGRLLTHEWRCLQTQEAVAADITPQEAAKYDAHFERAKQGGSWVELSQAREYFAKANSQVNAGRMCAGKLDR